jgi:sugar lactone lactonase YvrE
LTDADLATKVEDMGQTPAPDGMIFDQNGNLYMGNLEGNALMYRTADGVIHMLAQHEELKWPDTFTLDNQNNLYVTTSRIHQMEGDISDMEFSIFRIPAAG